MEQGRRLLGALEVAGAAFFAAGLALRTAHRRLMSIKQTPVIKLQGKIILIIGSNSKLGKELCLKFLDSGCNVICSDSTINPTESLPSNVSYICCDTSQSSQVSWLEKKVEADVGETEIIVWISKEINRNKTHLDQIADIVNNDFMQMIQVMTKFLPNLSTKDGHFIVIEPMGSCPAAFRSSENALTQLTDTLAQQMSYNGIVRTVRVTRRIVRRPDDDNPSESAADIVEALENGQSSITVPSATRHIKNTLRFLCGEIQNLWYTTIRQKKMISK